MEIDGDLFPVSGQQVAGTNGNMWLFARNGYANYGSFRIYSFSIVNATSVCILNLIPVLDPSGRPCMYDLVTKKPFYNQGTGEFTYA